MKKTYLLLPLAAFALMSSPADARKKAEAPVDLKPLMRQNFDGVIELQGLIADQRKFSEPAVQKEIKKYLDQMSGISHTLPEVMQTQRPGQAVIAHVYEDYLNDVRSGLESGSPDYLRKRIQTMTSFCFECHSSIATNKNFQDAQSKIEKNVTSPFERAEFYAATRQFDKALKTYMQILSVESQEKLGEPTLKRALRHALSISVRVKQDPVFTMTLLENFLIREDVSPQLKKIVQEWKKDVQRWQTEKPLPSTADTFALLKRAKSLIDHAQKRQKYPADRSADITYLRAIGYLQAALVKAQDPSLNEARAEAYANLGKSYGVLEDPLLWSIDDFYFEVCVREAPKTAFAKGCYEELKNELEFNYTGSMGTDIPSEEKSRLGRLEKYLP